MNTPNNTTLRPAPRFPGTGPIINSALSAIVGAAVALGAVAAWDAYDTNSAGSPAVVVSDPGIASRDLPAASPARGSMRHGGIVDSDPSVNYYADIALAPVAPNSRTLARGYVDSDPSLDYSVERSVASRAPAGPSSRGSMRHGGLVDVDPSVNHYDDLSAAPTTPSETRSMRHGGLVE